MKKHLITGGSGFIGAGLVERLLKKGDFVRILDNQSRGTPEHLRPYIKDIELVIGDIRNASIVKKACNKIDTVFHLAFINGTEFFYSKPDQVLDVGIKGIVNITEASIENNVKEFILASSSEVYQTPPSFPTDEAVPLSIPDVLNPRYSYGGGKIISELITINFGRKFFEKALVFRPHNVYGPNMGFEHVIPNFVLRIQKLIDESSDNILDFQINGTGQETRSFCFIEDFIDGLIMMYEKGEHLNIYNIGTEDEISINNLAKLISKYFEKNIKVKPGEILKGSSKRRCPNINKLKQLGFTPKINLEEGLKKTIPWYVKHYFEKKA